VVSHLGNLQVVALDSIDDAVLVRDPPRPVPREGVLEAFRLADPLARRALDFLDERVDALDDLAVGPRSGSSVPP